MVNTWVKRHVSCARGWNVSRMLCEWTFRACFVNGRFAHAFNHAHLTLDAWPRCWPWLLANLLTESATCVRQGDRIAVVTARCQRRRGTPPWLRVPTPILCLLLVPTRCVTLRRRSYTLANLAQAHPWRAHPSRPSSSQSQQSLSPRCCIGRRWKR